MAEDWVRDAAGAEHGGSARKRKRVRPMLPARRRTQQHAVLATKPRELGVFASGGFGTNQNSSDKFFNVGAIWGRC